MMNPTLYSLVALAILTATFHPAQACRASLSDSELYNDDDPSLPAVVRINAGGPTIIYGDSIFMADDFFGGVESTYTNNNISDILETTQDVIYKTERSTNANLQSFNYSIPVTNGEYSVNLHFAEIYWGATNGGPGGTGQRVFDVSLEGVAVLTDFDLNDEVAPMTAVIHTFITTVTDQSLDIVFSATVNQPKLSALEVYGEGNLLIDPSECTWNTLASSTLSKVEAQSVKVNDKLYVLAGFEAGLQITGATEIYTPATNTWTNGAPMPTPVTHMGAVAVGEEIWILAGFVGNHPGVATNLVQVYNTVSDTWTTGPPLPNPRGSGAGAYSDGMIHFFGGLLPDRMTDVGEHYVLDINNQAAGWQTAADMPEPRNHLSGAAVDGIIYAIGGQFGHDGGVDDQSFLHAYDPGTDTWTDLENLPIERSHFEPGTIVHNNKIIIVGGRKGGMFFDEVTEYNPSTDTWTELCALPSNLLAPAAKVFGDQLIVANGGENGTCCPLNETISIAIEPAQEETGFRVLIYHETNGFRHGSINAGIDMIEEFGVDNGWMVEESQNSSIFTDANLASADVVVWLNTSGNNLLTDDEQNAFESFIQNGGGFVGFHAATDTYRDGSWPWYNDLVGAIVQTSPNHTSNNFNATMDVVGSHPAVDHLGTEWNKNEEYYYWELNGGYLFDGNINLLQVRSTGNESYDAPRPMVWYKDYDGGRSFYTALGHNGSDYSNNKDFRTMALEAILWAGAVGFDCPALSLNIGDSCDDGNSETENDVVIDGCLCEGEIQSGSVLGSVDWNTNCSNRDFTIDFYTPGTSVLLYSFETTIDSNGDFNLGNGIEEGNYNIYAKIDGSLAKAFINTALFPGDNTLSLGTFIFGDLNNNNTINLSDLSLQNVSFGAAEGESNYNYLADLNCDGSVTVVDISILISGFGLSGGQP